MHAVELKTVLSQNFEKIKICICKKYNEKGRYMSHITYCMQHFCVVVFIFLLHLIVHCLFLFLFFNLSHKLNF